MHRIADLLDVVPGVLVDRRLSPDRRTTWRGGRRDSDWVNRPPGSLARMQRSERAGAWRRWLTTARTTLARAAQ